MNYSVTLTNRQRGEATYWYLWSAFILPALRAGRRLVVTVSYEDGK